MRTILMTAAAAFAAFTGAASAQETTTHDYIVVTAKTRNLEPVYTARAESFRTVMARAAKRAELSLAAIEYNFDARELMAEHYLLPDRTFVLASNE